VSFIQERTRVGPSTFSLVPILLDLALSLIRSGASLPPLAPNHRRWPSPTDLPTHLIPIDFPETCLILVAHGGWLARSTAALHGGEPRRGAHHRHVYGRAGGPPPTSVPGEAFSEAPPAARCPASKTWKRRLAGICDRRRSSKWISVPRTSLLLGARGTDAKLLIFLSLVCVSGHVLDCM
jgi:hypothetical protein